MPETVEKALPDLFKIIEGGGSGTLEDLETPEFIKVAVDVATASMAMKKMGMLSPEATNTAKRILFQAASLLALAAIHIGGKLPPLEESSFTKPTEDFWSPLTKES